MKETNVPSRFCFKCRAEIKPLMKEHHTEPENSMWHGGIIAKISAGYGSTLDRNMYIIAICDSCIEKGKDKLQYVGDYMMNLDVKNQ